MEWLVTIHNVWRYVVLFTALATLGMALMAYLGNRPWDAVSDRLSFFFTLAMDIQVLVGIGVWIFGDWERNDSFLKFVHPLLMLVAVGVAHAGRVITEREADSRAKGRKALLFFGGSLIIVLIAIPLAAWPL